jgi:glucose-1-phosphate thymidylyltransferase
MAETCAELGIPFVHISTDYVFDGSGDAPRAPDAPTAPLGAYGRSKLAGETGVRRGRGLCDPAHVLGRVGPWRQFRQDDAARGAARGSLRVVDDQIGGPTPAADIAAACLKIAAHLAERPGDAGIYHFAGAPDTSWAGFAEAIFEMAQLDVAVEHIPTTEYPLPAPRPLNSRLDCSDDRSRLRHPAPRLARGAGRHPQRPFTPRWHIMTKRKGIILAGGSGTRLYPITIGVSKQLLPIYDKPMIYYPISVLMLAGIREIAIITTPEDQAQFMRTLGDGRQWGLQFTYIVQPSPDGLAQAYLLARDFLTVRRRRWCWATTSSSATACRRCWRRPTIEAAGTVFGYRVADPERYGVVDFGPEGEVRAIIEKPKVPPSPYAVTGLYFLDGTAPERAAEVKPSDAGELEITSLLESYLHDGSLDVQKMGRGFRLARHRDPCEPSGCRELRAHADRTAGDAERIARGNRLCAGLDHRRSTARTYQFVYQERLWRLPEIPALRARADVAAANPSGHWRRVGRCSIVCARCFLRYASHHEARACGVGLPRHRLRRREHRDVCAGGWRLRLTGGQSAEAVRFSWPDGTGCAPRPTPPDVRRRVGGPCATWGSTWRCRARRPADPVSCAAAIGRGAACHHAAPGRAANPRMRRRMRRAFCRDMIRALPALRPTPCAGRRREASHQGRASA